MSVCTHNCTNHSTIIQNDCCACFINYSTQSTNFSLQDIYPYSKILSHLIQTFGINFISKKASEENNLDILEMCHIYLQDRPFDSFNVTCVFYAINNKNKKIIEFLINNNHVYNNYNTSDLINYSISKNFHELIPFLISKGGILTADCVLTAITFDNYDAFLWLHSIGCDINEMCLELIKDVKYFKFYLKNSEYFQEEVVLDYLDYKFYLIDMSDVFWKRFFYKKEVKHVKLRMVIEKERDRVDLLIKEIQTMEILCNDILKFILRDYL
jgi:hypothetical protein